MLFAVGTRMRSSVKTVTRICEGPGAFMCFLAAAVIPSVHL